MGPGAKAPAAPTAGKVLTHDEKVAAMLREADKYERDGTDTGRLMARGIRSGVALINARLAIETASPSDRAMLREALNAADAADLTRRIL